MYWPVFNSLSKMIALLQGNTVLGGTTISWNKMEYVKLQEGWRKVALQKGNNSTAWPLGCFCCRSWKSDLVHLSLPKFLYCGAASCCVGIWWQLSLSTLTVVVLPWLFNPNYRFCFLFFFLIFILYMCIYIYLTEMAV